MIEVRLFGGFRQFVDQPQVSVGVASDARVGDLRRAVEAHFDSSTNAGMLVRASAFATDKRILDDGEPVPFDAELSLLPPVSGG